METKVCTQCKQELPLTAFAFKCKAKGKRTSICGVCQRPYKLAHYYANRAHYIKKSMERNKHVVRDFYTKVDEYLQDHPCVDCGTTELVVLQFDHRDPKDKCFNIKEMVSRGYSWRAVLAEISKCDVRCANCHVRRHGTVHRLNRLAKLRMIQNE